MKRKYVTEEDLQPKPKATKQVERSEVSEAEEEEVKLGKGVKKLNQTAMASNVSRLVKLSTFEPETRFWLDTGSPDLNAVLGSRDLGVPYGKIISLSGKPHGGKTAAAIILAGLAQQDGAGVIYADAENSCDEQWCAKLGLDLPNTFLIQPKLVTDAKHPKATDWRLESAEEIFAEAEAAMQQMKAQGFDRQFLMVDSVANLSPAIVIEAGTTGQNMRTNSGRAMFLSTALPKWAGLAANYNVMIVLINQIRTRPGVIYGNPEYETGGNALEHNCAVRAYVRRAKNGKVRQNGKTIGLLGIMTNRKNKAGGGSSQDEECGYRIVWGARGDTKPARIKFMSKDAAEDAFAEGEK